MARFFYAFNASIGTATPPPCGPGKAGAGAPPIPVRPHMSFTHFPELASIIIRQAVSSRLQ